jgi:hypothetical protein
MIDLGIFDEVTRCYGSTITTNDFLSHINRCGGGVVGNAAID